MPRRSAKLTGFVGRQRELAELSETLEKSSLVTVTGPGGIGKSRLVQQVLCADEMVVFAHLDSAHNAEEIVGAIASAAGVHEQSESSLFASLLEYLQTKPRRLVLDPCEHVVEATAAIVTELLAAVPSMSVVVVSRHVLGVEGEVVRRIGPMAISEAVELLLERASRVDAESVAVASRAACEQLCRRLDATPLAIELAAARLPVLSPEEVLDRLTDRFSLLRRGEQTLAATVDWSYALLNDVERRAFRKLSVFRAPFDLDAASHVAGIELDTLQALVDKSLVHTLRSARHSRYFLLDTLREYGLLKLYENDEAETTMRRLAECMVELVRNSYPGRPRSTLAYPAYQEVLHESYSNLAAALEWASRNDPELFVPMAACSWLYFVYAGKLSEGAAWLTQAVSVPGGVYEESGLALMGAAGLLSNLGRFPEAIVYYEASIDRAHADGDADRERKATLSMAVCRWKYGEREAALRTLTAVWNEAQGLEGGNPFAPHNTSLIQTLQGSWMLALGNAEDARTPIEAGLKVARDAGIKVDEVAALVSLAELERRQRRWSAVAHLMRQAVAVLRLEPSPLPLKQLLETAAAVAADTNRRAVAARLWGAARSAGLAGSPFASTFLEEHQATVSDALRALGDQADREFAVGMKMSRDEALGLVEMETVSRAAAPLTERQLEVARLVASGLTNREIAGRLFLTERGAEGHVERIRDRLGLKTRSQIAAWVREMGYRN